MHFYQFNVSDYRKDTAQLTPVQHMIYRWLIDQYYLDEKPLQNNLPKLLWLMGLGGEQQSDLELILEHFFTPGDNDDWVHGRIERDIADYRALQEKKSRAGKKSARSKSNTCSTPVQHLFNTCPTPVQQEVDSVQLTRNYKLETRN